MGHSVPVCTTIKSSLLVETTKAPISGCPEIIVHTQSNAEQDNYSKNSHVDHSLCLMILLSTFVNLYVILDFPHHLYKQKD